jgi:hypothetical protein
MPDSRSILLRCWPQARFSWELVSLDRDEDERFVFFCPTCPSSQVLSFRCIKDTILLFLYPYCSCVLNFVIVHFHDLRSVMNYKSAFQKFQGTCRKTCKRKRVEKCERERALNRGWITHSKFGLALSYLRFTSLLSLLKMFAFAHFTQVFLKAKTTCQNTVLRLLRSYKRIILYESIYSSTRSELKHAHDLAQHPHPTPHTPPTVQYVQGICESYNCLFWPGF